MRRPVSISSTIRSAALRGSCAAMMGRPTTMNVAPARIASAGPIVRAWSFFSLPAEAPPQASGQSFALRLQDLWWLLLFVAGAQVGHSLLAWSHAQVDVSISVSCLA